MDYYRIWNWLWSRPQGVSGREDSGSSDLVAIGPRMRESRPRSVEPTLLPEHDLKIRQIIWLASTSGRAAMTLGEILFDIGFILVTTSAGRNMIVAAVLKWLTPF